MLRASPIALHWRAKTELQRARRYFPSRAKYEFKLGYKFMLAKLKNETQMRIEMKRPYARSTATLNVDSAAREHGVRGASLRNDLGRHNVHLYNNTMRRLALYEPMSFRALAELASSAIPPPAPPTIRVEAPFVAGASEVDTTRRILSADIDRLRSDSRFSMRDVPAEDWLNAWKAFVHPSESDLVAAHMNPTTTAASGGRVGK